MMPYTIYLVDDDEQIRDASALTLGRQYHLKTFSNAEAVLCALSGKTHEAPDLILLDIGLPGISGIEALKQIKSACPKILVLMLTAADDIKTVVAAMKLGAYDYVVKPIDMQTLEVNIANALETIKLRKEVQLLQEKYLRENLPFFIGESDIIQDVLKLVETVAKSPKATVLILGETGTGKELIASFIHYQSPNFRGPFVALNCSALPEELLESELFGYEKGAFSGALATGKKGLIETAQSGTLFLDEVGDLGYKAQAKVLRFLESGEFYKVGGTSQQHIETRVVAATNKDLEDLVTKGLFRKDLYYRLAVIKIEVPSLNRRPDDILPMARHFLQGFSLKLGRSFTGISPDARDALRTHAWKGNVRELRNLIERAVLIGQEPEITEKDLGLAVNPLSLQPSEPSAIPSADHQKHFLPLSMEGIDLPKLHTSLDRHYFRQSLELSDGNATKAARLLKMSYFAFRRRQEKLQLWPAKTNPASHF
jgi:DNA-binding NtrC family response regulator